MILNGDTTIHYSNDIPIAVSTVVASDTTALAPIREIKEEIGIDIDPLVNVYNSVTPWGVHVSWYTAKMLTHEILVDPQEVQWCRWLSEAEVRQHPDLLESNRQFFDALDANVFQLPDVTA